MSLDKTTLASSIKSALAAGLADTSDSSATAQENLAKAIANAVDTYVKGITITVPAGIAVSTAGTAAAQTGATTAPATCTVS